MVEELFEQAYPHARRAAGVFSASAVATASIISADREDIQQQAIVALWHAMPRFDPARASLRTFVERVVHSKVSSAVRARRAHKRSLLAGTTPDPCESAASAIHFRTDVERVLARLSPEDRLLAALLVDHTRTEVSRILGQSRSTIYERIEKLRVPFIQAGFAPKVRRGFRTSQANEAGK